MLDDIFNDGYKIGIFGGGVSGCAIAKWCDAHGIIYTIFDDNCDSCMAFAEDKIKSCDLILKSPSFLEDNKWVQFIRSMGIECLSELDLASYFWKGKIIAVTGTDGKTTTTMFLTHALENVGYHAVAVGNIGTPFIGVVDFENNKASSYAIVEVSSFQASSLKIFHPDYVIWTNFAPDHLDKHGSLGEYFSAKYHLLEMVRICDRHHVFLGKSVSDFPQKYHGFQLLDEAQVCAISSSLPSESCLSIPVQRENYSIVECFWLAVGLDIKLLKTSAKSFSLPKHRLQMVATISKLNESKDAHGVEFWNDSKATNFHSFKAALDSFDKKLITVVGGKSKGEDVHRYINAILDKSKALLLLGQTGKIICDTMMSEYRENGLKCLKYYGNEACLRESIIEKIVKDAFCIAVSGDIVLFSPGFSSLDMFDSYEQRGDFYEKFILKLY